MSAALSPNTRAILLLIAGRGRRSADLLIPGEYKRLAQRQEIGGQRADPMAPNGERLIEECRPAIEALQDEVREEDKP